MHVLRSHLRSILKKMIRDASAGHGSNRNIGKVFFHTRGGNYCVGPHAGAPEMLSTKKLRKLGFTKYCTRYYHNDQCAALRRGFYEDGDERGVHYEKCGARYVHAVSSVGGRAVLARNYLPPLRTLTLAQAR